MKFCAKNSLKKNVSFSIRRLVVKSKQINLRFPIIGPKNVKIHVKTAAKYTKFPKNLEFYFGSGFAVLYNMGVSSFHANRAILN